MILFLSILTSIFIFPVSSDHKILTQYRQRRSDFFTGLRFLYLIAVFGVNNIVFYPLLLGIVEGLVYLLVLLICQK